ncbi:MAG: class I SAM-dependent methyltransferase [Candidatus Bathyarchaeia archaeon]
MKLDVGCGSNPSGDVNIDFLSFGWNSHEGKFMNPRLVSNFVVADAVFLPFRDGCFDVAFSSHVIEHVKDPYRMLSELLRVSKKEVVVRCPHRRGSGAKRPHHINYLDEDWFLGSLAKLGYSAKVLVTIFDYPVSSRLALICPRKLQFLFGRNILYRVVGKVEKKLLKVPFEFEIQVSKSSATANCK